MIRTFEHSIIERFAAHSRVPVINGLTNEYHPCQILADIYTYIEQRGSIAGKTVAWVGDSNNVCNRWLQAAPSSTSRCMFPRRQATSSNAATAGCVARTTGRSPTRWRRARRRPRDHRRVDQHGLRGENEARKRAFADWMVDADMMAQAKPDALFMHCLPAHRGEEVAADVIDGPQSVVWDEAENRLHAQKALLEYLVCGRVAA